MRWNRNYEEHTSSSFFLPRLLLVPAAALKEVVVGMGSSLGNMSIRKSNWSDLAMARDMSDRERVRRLFESATMNARAVISAIKTFDAWLYNDIHLQLINEVLTFACLAKYDWSCFVHE